jgi:hypothetical protein
MRYIAYSRDESGIVSRLHQTARMAGEMRRVEYPYAESLRGWPERTVYWQHATGPSVGVAPAR